MIIICEKCKIERQAVERHEKYLQQFLTSEIASKFTFTELAFERDIYNLVNDKQYRILAKLKCNICGAEEWVRPKNFNYTNEKNYAHRCHACPIQNNLDSSYRISTGEQRCREVLSELKIPYNIEYSFNDLYNPETLRCLRFDFAIFQNQNLIGLIEYDGEQHFRPVAIFGGEEAFKTQVLHDNMKNEYCQQHSIPLLRIKHEDYNMIKPIINRWLKTL